MGMILLVIFLIALIPALVLALILLPRTQKEWLCIIGTTMGYKQIALFDLGYKAFHRILVNHLRN